MSETLEVIVVDVSKMETTAPTREKSSAVGNAAAKHQFREVAKMIPHEEVEDASEMKDYSNVRAVCFDCARKAGFVQKKKAVIVLEDECGICKARRPCTDLHHDWMQPKEESEVK